jgi:hypothetical protein
MPRWRRLGRPLGLDLLPPPPEGPPAHALGTVCDEILRRFVGEQIGILLARPLKDATDGETYQLPRGVRVAQSLAHRVGGLDGGGRRPL